MLRTILTILQVISALAIVALVLLQRGKGADAGAGFGAGASGTVFGARGASTGLSRMTAIFAAIFMINSLCLTYLFQRDARVANNAWRQSAWIGNICEKIIGQVHSNCGVATVRGSNLSLECSRPSLRRS